MPLLYASELRFYASRVGNGLEQKSWPSCCQKPKPSISIVFASLFPIDCPLTVRSVVLFSHLHTFFIPPFSSAYGHFIRLQRSSSQHEARWSERPRGDEQGAHIQTLCFCTAHSTSPAHRRTELSSLENGTVEDAAAKNHGKIKDGRIYNHNPMTDLPSPRNISPSKGPRTSDRW